MLCGCWHLTQRFEKYERYILGHFFYRVYKSTCTLINYNIILIPLVALCMNVFFLFTSRVKTCDYVMSVGQTYSRL